MQFGTSFSPQQARDFGLNPDKTFVDLLDLRFDLIRLGCYWNRIEKQPGIYDFSEISKFFDLCQKNNQKVVVTVGMKAPRWPEFHLPPWLKDKSFLEIEKPLLSFLFHCINTMKHCNSIDYWQVENEPLDPSGPNNLRIPFDLLKKEIELVRQLDPSRPIITTVWGNELTKRNNYSKLLPISDFLGLDIYYHVPDSKGRFFGPRNSDKKFAEIVARNPQKIWITELQAEPWEHNVTTPQTLSPKSINPEILKENIRRSINLKPTTIFFWGCEYWHWCRSQGFSDYWQIVRSLVKENQLK